MSTTTDNAPNKQNILHPATSVVALEASGPRMVESAQGAYITDGDGQQKLDGIAGLWCSNIGHGREEIAQTMANACQQLDYFHTFNAHTNQAQIELADRLIKMAPDSLSHVFYGCTGSDANDTLVKIAWQYHRMRGKPSKRKIISRWQAYHGTSISTASLTGLKSFHKEFGLPLDFAVHTDRAFFYADGLEGQSSAEYAQTLLNRLEDLIAKEGADNIAAFIGEPIMGAGGVITPPEGYWVGVQEICRRNDILLIADEVVSGFGRTGENFVSGHYGIEPDMMTTAKGITAGVFPMSAAFISEAIHDQMRNASQQLGGFAHGYTYSGHPIGAAVANNVLDIMEREDLVGNSARVGAYLHEKLNQRLIGNPHVGEIRGKGLLASIQLMENAENKTFLDPADKFAAKVSEACYQKGLVIRPLPTVNSLALSPPLILTNEQVDQIVDIVESGINEIFEG